MSEQTKDELAKDEQTSEKESVVGWNAAAERARRSVPWLRRRHAQGVLHSVRNEAGEHVFKRADLEALRPPEPPPSALTEAHAGPVDSAAGALPSTLIGDAAPSISPVRKPMSKGELYAVVFGELDAHTPITAIVRKLQVPPAEVMEIYDEWKKVALVDVNVPSVPAEIERLKKRLEPLATENEQLRKIITDTKSSVEGWDKHFKSIETILHRIPFFWPKGVPCPSCGRNSWLPRQVMCMSCCAVPPIFPTRNSRRTARA